MAGLLRTRMKSKTRMLATLGLSSIMGLATLSCRSPVDDPNSTVPGRCSIEAPIIEASKTDILFVIDNSKSMAEEQQAVAKELESFVTALQNSPVKQDFQVGVITTAVYQNYMGTFHPYPDQSGKLQAVPVRRPDGTLGPGTERILSSSDANLVPKFQLLVNQGISGSAQETPFEAVRLAVASDLATTPVAQGGNAGFLRDGSQLLVVLLTDEDDCSENVRPPNTGLEDCYRLTSLTSVETYANLFKQLKDRTGATRPVIWATIGPVARATKVAQALPPEKVGEDVFVARNVDCPTSEGAGIRVRAMAQQFDATLQNLDSICNPSYHDTLLTIASLATVRQFVDVTNIPDPRLLYVELSRANAASPQVCTLANGGLRYEPATNERPSARIHFGGTCPRRADDTKIAIKMLCAG